MKTEKWNYLAIGFGLIFSVASLNAQTLGTAQQPNAQSPVFEIKSLDAQKAFTMKAEVQTSEISAKMGEMYKKLYSYLGENHIQPVGPPFAVYYSFDPSGKTVFEAGVPVASVQKSPTDIVFKEYPAMKVLKTLYVGEYEKMAPVYEKMEQYLKDQKLESTNMVWEVYLTDPATVKSPADNQTLIYYCIK